MWLGVGLWHFGWVVRCGISQSRSFQPKMLNSKISDRAWPFSLFQAIILCSSSSEQKHRSRDSLSKSIGAESVKMEALRGTCFEKSLSFLGLKLWGKSFGAKAAEPVFWFSRAMFSSAQVLQGLASSLGFMNLHLWCFWHVCVVGWFAILTCQRCTLWV